MSSKPAVRCAVYTRKSTEEGLEQDFNSLDAQRDACESYIASQKAEGWIARQERYDDGGFSGGTLERPALKRLLADIESGKVDVVVVYKIDRLSRSLMDFAKLVEVFDRKQVTFVSVTQSFNTTTSMGRLTLNVLLSFAQFEREVTGERIRDKIAASKRKGIWMGGTPPLGYEIVERKLIVVPEEAKTVRMIFQRYLELGSARALRDDLRVRAIHSKSWISRTGRNHPGVPIRRGGLYHMLKNRIYIVQITHRDESHPGEHEGIVPGSLFDAVQRRIEESRQCELGKLRARRKALLTGILFDTAGALMSPSHSINPAGNRYSYYASPPGLSRHSQSDITRIPATSLEDVILAALQRLQLLPPAADQSREDIARSILQRVDIAAHSITLQLDMARAIQVWRSKSPQHQDFSDQDLLVHYRSYLIIGEEVTESKDHLRLVLPVRASFRGGRSSILHPQGLAPQPPQPNSALIKALANAHRWKQMLLDGKAHSIEEIAKRFGYDRRDAGRILALASLSPGLTRQILDGRQHSNLRLQHLLDNFVPLLWREQSAMTERLFASAPAFPA